ncbi:MAG: Lrp/AsnC family transcriptional regulator [Verrucomicrobia bacterium]|nr:Lrp/AsnC family transcriptional regulator [Verrucomicrobiota bacterium]MCF7709045.1 Lrp/AsnC family transcriptional regulator [Verrucomicrobiota bacterium]
MDPVLKLIRERANLTPERMSRMLDIPTEEIKKKIESYENEGVLLAYRAVVNEEKLGLDAVRAVIEVKISPEREGGFDKLAQRIAKYREVRSCYLMSGAYDLLVIVEGESLKDAALFVSEKLATIPGVLSTATHFMLKCYKEQGILMTREYSDEHLAVSP